MMGRRNILKQVVFRRLIEVRELKRKPKLSDLLRMFKDDDDETNKEKLIAYIKKLYEVKGEEAKIIELEDIKYERIQSSLDRL